MKRTPMRRMSPQRRRKIATETDVRRTFLARHRECEAKDAPGDCWGPLTVHEVLPRARGGDTGDPRYFAAVCNEHNRRISQDAETMRWAYEHGLLLHAHQRDEFLKNGGRA